MTADEMKVALKERRTVEYESAITGTVRGRLTGIIYRIDDRGGLYVSAEITPPDGVNSVTIARAKDVRMSEQ